MSGKIVRWWVPAARVIDVAPARPRRHFYTIVTARTPFVWRPDTLAERIESALRARPVAWALLGWVTRIVR